MPSEAAEAGEDQGLPPHGGGVHQEPGADEASGGEAGGTVFTCLSGSPSIIFLCGTLIVLFSLFGGNLRGQEQGTHYLSPAPICVLLSLSISLFLSHILIYTHICDEMF